MPQTRSSLAKWVLVSSALAACATGASNGATTDDPFDGGAATLAHDSGAGEGSIDDASTGPKGNPVTLDSSPTTTDGATNVDAALDAPNDPALDAPVDSPVDAPVDVGVDAPISCGTPSGSYSMTCSSCTVTGTVLSCQCQNDEQVLGPTSLDMCTCAQPPVISNQNGVLTCP
jgi:hypothetical protein